MVDRLPNALGIWYTESNKGQGISRLGFKSQLCHCVTLGDSLTLGLLLSSPDNRMNQDEYFPNCALWCQIVSFPKV